MTSRKGWAVPLKNKTAASVGRALETILESADPPTHLSRLVTDAGSEFVSRDFARVCSAHNISRVVVEARNHARMGRIDRFHLTLRTLVERWYLASGTHNWVDHISAMLANYNDHVNRTTGLAPSSVTDADRRRINTAEVGAVLLSRARVAPSFPAGQLVRYVRNKAAFEKGATPRWSATTATVSSAAGPNTFWLHGHTDKPFRSYELQPVLSPVAAPAPAVPRASLVRAARIVRKVRASSLGRIKALLGVRSAPSGEREYLTWWAGYPKKSAAWNRESVLAKELEFPGLVAAMEE